MYNSNREVFAKFYDELRDTSGDHHSRVRFTILDKNDRGRYRVIQMHIHSANSKSIRQRLSRYRDDRDIEVIATRNWLHAFFLISLLCVFDTK